MARFVMAVIGLSVLAACKTPEVEVTTVPTLVPIITKSETAVPTAKFQNLPAVPPIQDESPTDLLALKETPTRSPTTTPTPDPDAILIIGEPIFVGGDVRVQGWSPDGRYLAYFEYTEEQVAQSPVPGLRGTVPGTFTFYDTVTRQKCQRYPLDGRFPHEGPGHGQRFTWLANGDLLIFTEDGQIIQADSPCGQDENLNPLFPEQMQNIHSQSPDEQLLLLHGATAYWLYNIDSHAIYSIAEITPDSFNNLIWSPVGTYIAVTLAGNYTGSRSPIGGTRVVDVATGQIIARHDWEPANALDGTFGGPVWLNETEMVVTLSLDQGPFFMAIAGEVRPLLSLFDLEFERGKQMPSADVYIEPYTDHYHILLTDMNWGEERLLPQIFHEDTGAVEKLDLSQDDEVYLTANGILVADRSGTNWVRSITAVGEPWQPTPKCVPPWYTPTTKYFARSPGTGRVDIYVWPDCQPRLKLQLAWTAEGARYLDAGISPDDQWIVLTPNDEHSRGLALFLIPIDNLERMKSP